MGISIEEKAIKTLNEIIDEGWLISDMEKCIAIDACEFAIDRINKYQKIEEIVKFGNANELGFEYVGEKITEVMEDGNKLSE